MASPSQGQQQQAFTTDRYVVIHVSTTCDEHGVYVTKDSAEVIEFGWIVLDSTSLEEVGRDNVLVKPVNTPITPLCTSLTTLTWEHVRNAGTFRDAINKLDNFANEHLISKNLDFVFVTLDAWDLRVQLPREARDKAVVLPPYLQHSRTFDLRTEYQRWQQHHPESLPFGPSMLTNICAALEVEPVQANAPIKHNLPFHLQALAPSSPRRALEEAVTYARVIRSLIRKSQPAADHPDVLTRPMDARADVRAFLSERSKVLHMSGLPHDTTQSELESWFTQFGGRPIAFWTIRAPDQHKPTGTGFAVFSSHEEAAESLCMNGRALSEKAIEVSPSSSRVLDRAQDMLSPFPPSKNRPRPGDWTCPSCGFSNFQRRTACFRCSISPLGVHPAAGPDMGGGAGYGPGGGGGAGYGYGSPSMMAHPQHMGGHPHHHHHGGGGIGGGPGGGGPGGMGHGHGPGGGGGGHRGSVPFRAGDWKCGNDACQYHNFAKNVCCLRCGASRAGAAIVADSGFNSPMDPALPYGQNQMAGSPFGSTHGGGYATPGGYVPVPAGHFAAVSSNYALPSGIAGSPAGLGSHHHHHAGQQQQQQPQHHNHYGVAGGMMSTHFGPAMPGPHHHPQHPQHHHHHHPSGPFDSRAAEAAFQAATNGPASTAGSTNNSAFYQQGSEADPFAFLSSGMNSLSVSSSEGRTNGSSAPQKQSPA